MFGLPTRPRHRETAMTTATPISPQTSAPGSRATRAANGVIAAYIRSLSESFEEQPPLSAEPLKPAQLEARSRRRSQARRRPCAFPTRALAELA